MHEDTMQTERTRAHDARRVEKLFVLLLVSMGLSFAAHVRSPRKPTEADRSKVARRDAPSRSRQVRKLIKAAHAGLSKQIETARTGQPSQIEQPGPFEAANAGQSKQIEAARTSQSSQIEQPGPIKWLRGPKLVSW